MLHVQKQSLYVMSRSNPILFICLSQCASEYLSPCLNTQFAEDVELLILLRVKLEHEYGYSSWSGSAYPNQVFSLHLLHQEVKFSKYFSQTDFELYVTTVGLCSNLGSTNMEIGAGNVSEAHFMNSLQY